MQGAAESRHKTDAFMRRQVMANQIDGRDGQFGLVYLVVPSTAALAQYSTGGYEVVLIIGFNLLGDGWLGRMPFPHITAKPQHLLLSG